MSLPPLLSKNLEPALIKKIRPFLRAFFSEVNIKEEEIENFALAFKEYKDLDLLIFDSPARIAFPGRKRALRNLCKMTIKKFEELKIDPSDVLYKNLCFSMQNDDEYFFKIFPLNFCQFSSPSFDQNNYIVIRQSVQNISKGTTGLSCWQASFALADFLFLSFSTTNLIPYLFNAKCILELGAGCGLAGISIAKQLFFTNKKNEIKVILSDSDCFVLEQLNENIKLNFGEEKDNQISVESKYLDWTNFIPEDLPPADIIIASDIIYDPVVFPQLIQLLEYYLLLNNQNSSYFPIVIIACTIRDPETLESFLKLAASRRIKIKKHWKLCGQINNKEDLQNISKMNYFINLKDPLNFKINFEPLFLPFLNSQIYDFENIVIFEFILEK